MNVLQAIAAAHALGIDRDRSGPRAAPTHRAARSTRAGGEPRRGVPPSSLITRILTTRWSTCSARCVRSCPPTARLRVVFGCGGDRDRTKRPRMMHAALEGADDVMVTSDNPRTEDPAAIVDEILAAVPDEARDRVSALVDREEAIHAAIERAATARCDRDRGEGPRGLPDHRPHAASRSTIAWWRRRRSRDDPSGTMPAIATAVHGTLARARPPPAAHDTAGHDRFPRRSTPGALFVALRGAHVDGHDYLGDAAAAHGARRGA